MNKGKKVIIDKKYELLKTLGKGATSQVFLANNLSNSQKCAVKIFNNHIKDGLKGVDYDTFIKEVKIMTQLNNQNLIKIIDYNIKGILDNEKSINEVTYLAVELANNAELFDFIAYPAKPLSEDIAKVAFIQMLNGITSMHKKNIAHRDLKTENIFLNGDFIIKIGDFGFSKYIRNENHKDKKLKTVLGTTGYQSPELLLGEGYDGEANDVFSLGVILFILVTARPPFREATAHDPWYKLIYNKNYETFWEIMSKHDKENGIELTLEVKDLITGMLINEKQRYSLKKILNHPWLKDNIASEEKYYSDMLKRKVLVDSKRKDILTESFRTNNDSDDNHMIYRGEIDEEISRLLRQLEVYNVEFFEKPVIKEYYPNFFIKFEDNDYIRVYKFLISKLVEEEITVEIDNYNFTLKGEVQLDKLKDNDNEGLWDDGDKNIDCDLKLKFIANLYLDENSQTTVVEFINDSSSNKYDLIQLVKFLKHKLMNEE